MRVHREGHGVNQVTGDGAAAGWVVTRQAVTAESVSRSSGHRRWHPGERGRSAGRRGARGLPEGTTGAWRTGAWRTRAARAAPGGPRRRGAARGGDERERGRGRDRYRLVYPLMAIAAIFSHAVSFTSYGPIPFTESSDRQKEEICQWD